MIFRTKDRDMLHGPLLKKLLLFTLPIALSSIVQQLFNAADTAVIGYFGNADALAAVGTNTETIALIVTLSSGLAIGANILIAGQIGRNEKEKIPAATQTAICLSVLIGFVGLFHSFFSGLFTPDQAVIENASVRILCILLFEPVCSLYEIPAGFLRGSGHALYPAICTMLGTCVFRIVWICTVFRSNPTLPVLYHAFPLSWVATILLVSIGIFALRFLSGPESKKRHHSIQVH